MRNSRHFFTEAAIRLFRLYIRRIYGILLKLLEFSMSQKNNVNVEGEEEVKVRIMYIQDHSHSITL